MSSPAKPSFSLANLVFAACANPAKQIKSHPDVAERRKLGNVLKIKMREARRFSIDEDVMHAATRLGVQHPDILLQMLRRARAPFKTVWLEWDNIAQMVEAGRRVTPGLSERVGVLIERMDEQHPLYRMTIIAQDNTQQQDNASAIVAASAIVVSPMTVVYHLDEPVLPAADETLISTIAELPQSYIRTTLIGSTYVRRPDETDEDAIAHRRALCDTLANHATHRIAPFFAPVVQATLANSGQYDRAMVGEVIRTAVLENAGTWRMVISLFALINARDYVESERIGPRGTTKRFVGGKIVPYLDHYTVSLKLPRKLVEQRLITAFAEAIPRRRHEVIGHWKHSRKRWPGKRDCNHVYVNETPLREVCVHDDCQHKRWWVNEFQRGDATLGFVLKDRVVIRD